MLSDSTKEIHDSGTMKCITITDTQELDKEIWVIDVESVEPFIIPTEVKGYYPVNLDKFGDEFKKEDLTHD